MKMRLHQFLSKCDEFSSKRDIKEAIWGGEIQINDSIMKDIKFEFNPNTKVVSYQGKVLKLPIKNHYFLVNKPSGYICSRLNRQEKELEKIEIAMGISEKLSAYEQVLETFLIHTNKTDDELRIIAYLRRAFEISDSEHRAILRSLDRQLEEIVHRNVRENIRYELKEINKRLAEVLDSVRIQK